jgi:hypothetical protein
VTPPLIGWLSISKSESRSKTLKLFVPQARCAEAAWPMWDSSMLPSIRSIFAARQMELIVSAPITPAFISLTFTPLAAL